MRRGRGSAGVAGWLAAFLGALALMGGGAAAKNSNVYRVEKVTIKVDRGARQVSGTVISEGDAAYFCTSGFWAIKIRVVGPGKDKVIRKLSTHAGDYTLKFRSADTKGERVYAEVPTFRNPSGALCVGARSQTVTAP